MTYHLIIDSFIGPWAYSKQYVRNSLNPYKGKHVDVKVTSLGGNLDHALDIRQQFLDHGDVTVYLSGFVASAATVIAMGAKRIVMSKYAMFLVHKCSNFLDVWGSYNADQMQKLIEDLEANKKENDKIDVVLANMYADKCKKPVKDILNILKEGRWLNAQEALELGFIDEIAEPDNKTSKLNFSADLNAKFNALGISTLGLESSKENLGEEAVSTGLLNRIASATAKAFAKLKDNVEEPTITEPAKSSKMKNFKFSKVESLLKLDSITPDADGHVTVSAEEFEQLNNKLDELDKAAAEKSAALTEKEAEIAQLKEQVENLKKNPGDDTFDVEDTGAEDSVSANDLFNLIKSAI